MRPRNRNLAAAVAVAVVLPAPSGAAAPAPVADATHRPPVGGRVVHPFDPPAERFGSGHRGVDLEAGVGDPVAASAAGTVTFAGAVAGDRWVTVAHPDGLVTSYGPLATVEVAVGDHVVGGDRLGTLAGGHHPLVDALHWSARRDGVYVDPLRLLGAWRPALLGPGRLDFGDAPPVPRYEPWPGRRSGPLGALGFLAVSPVATGPGWPLAPNPNHVVGVAGLGSSSGRLPIDLGHLGYAPEDVTYLSYAGRSPDGEQRPYTPEDTYAGVEAAVEVLDAELRASTREHPGRAVDLVGHSLGGVVVLHWLLTRHDPADPALPPVGHVVAIAAPLEGADLVAALRSAIDPLYVPVVEAVSRSLGGPGLRDPSVGDLAPGSALLTELSAAWRDARDGGYAGPLALGTRVLTVGGSRDLVVPEHRTDLPGAPHVVAPGGHDRVRRTEASRQVVRAFLAGQDPPGGPGGAGHLVSYLVGGVEQVAGEVVGAYTSPARVLGGIGRRSTGRPPDR